MVLSLRELIYSGAKAESSFIFYLQNWIGENNPYLLGLSKFFNFANFITILFPVFASVDTKLGYKILLITAYSEWFNTLFKWAFVEDRPYWWVQEHRVPIPLRQSDLTCETTFGSPSGHVACTVAVGFVLYKWLCVWLENNVANSKMKYRLGFFFIAVYSIIVALVSLARITMATNFPHQCLEGILFGSIYGSIFNNEFSPYPLPQDWQRIVMERIPHRILMASVIIVSSVMSYACRYFSGDDYEYTDKMAFNYCNCVQNMSVTTTPIYFLVRDCGCFLALALVTPIKERKFYPVVGVIVTTLFVVGTRLLKPLLPTNDPFQFYFFHFLEHLFIGVCLLTIVPFIASLIRFKPKTE